jgi:serine/threonine protein kinase
MKAGAVIGEGSFGEVFDDIKDLDNPLEYYDYNLSNHEVIIDSDIFHNKVFKYINYQKELENELDNMLIVRKNVDINLTCLDDEIYYILTDDDTKVPVYTKQDNNLQNYLYNSKGSYYKTWTTTDIKIINIDKSIQNILSFCKSLHEEKYIHKDLKLDNIFIKNDICIVGDYGLITKNEDDIGINKVFMGMVDYMPPFCHFTEGINSSPYDSYKKRMKSLFTGDLNSKRSQAPIKQMNEDFFDKICETYKNNNIINKYKIDLHPIGIMILQLLYRFDLDDKKLEDFAIKLMSNDGFYNAIEAYDDFKTMTGGSRYITILGKKRKIIKKNNRDYITYNKELITVNKAKKLQNKK